VGIKFTTWITTGDVELGEVANTSDLNVVGSLDEMDALEGAVGDGPGATATLCAPSDTNALSVANVTDVRRSPETEVINIIDPCGLALGRLGRGRSTVVDTILTVLGLVGESIVSETRVPNLVGVSALAVPDLSLNKVEHIVVSPGKKVRTYTRSVGKRFGGIKALEKNVSQLPTIDLTTVTLFLFNHWSLSIQKLKDQRCVALELLQVTISSLTPLVPLPPGTLRHLFPKTW
jgi:hypothetical protein